MIASSVSQSGRGPGQRPSIIWRAAKLKWPLAILLVVGSVLPRSGWSTVRLLESGQGHVRLLYEASGADQELGEGCVVGIPPQGKVALHLVEVVESEIDPASVDNAEELKLDFLLDGPAHLGEPGILRNQRVVHIAFSPRLTPTGRLIRFARVVVDVWFNPASGRRSANADAVEEGLYRASLINYEQARGWRIPRSVPAVGKRGNMGGSRMVRIAVREQGMYRITGADLAALGIDLRMVDPSRLGVLYGGGEALGLSLPKEEFALQQEAVVVEDGGDGSFDPDDFLLFYGESLQRWVYRGGRYQYLKNPYTRDNIYWLELDGESTGRRAQTLSGAPVADNLTAPEDYRVRFHGESEERILVQPLGINSGYTWYWHDFRGNARNFSPPITNSVAKPVDIRLRFFAVQNHAGNYPLNEFIARWNEDPIGVISFADKASYSTKLVARSGPENGINRLGLFHTGHGARLDWYELEYSRSFVAEREELLFDYPVVGEAEFRLEGFHKGPPRIFEYSQGLRELDRFVAGCQAYPERLTANDRQRNRVSTVHSAKQTFGTRLYTIRIP